MDRIFVKPGEGLKVRHTHTHRLMPDEGEWVPQNAFWLRRIRDKDVIVVDPQPAPPAAEPAPAAPAPAQ